MGRGVAFEDKELQALLAHWEQVLKQKNPTDPKKKKVIVISGPTAVGKTQLSLIIARAIGGEIISADSMQVYRGMDIGTAKASREERVEIPHHLIDSRDLDENFSVIDFYQEATQSIREIFSKGRTPIVVGGTGFYLHALIYGPPSGPTSVPEVRKRLEKEMEEQGPLALYDQLKEQDPEYAHTITFRDRHKIVRGLEIIELTGQKVSSFSKSSEKESDEYDFRCWFLYKPKEVLYPLIEKRCDEMLREGLVAEVRQLENEGLSKNKTAVQAIGYKQCLQYLKTAQTPDDYEQFIVNFKQASRHYAKRQLTWFRKETLFRWVDLQEISVEMAAELMIQDYELSF